MSVKGLVVHLRRDLDDHEVERMIDALMMLKGVTKVTPVETRYEDDLNRHRVKRELLDKIRALLIDNDAVDLRAAGLGADGSASVAVRAGTLSSRGASRPRVRREQEAR